MKGQSLGKKYNYVWDYLIPESNDRSKKLEKIIQPFLINNETILDVVCGFSPLTPFLNRRFKSRIIGFDINPNSIAYCQNKYNRKLNHYYVSSDASFQNNTPIDVLLHLGISPDTNPLEPVNEIDFSRKEIIKYQPRLIILESSLGSPEGLNKLVNNIYEMVNYNLVKKTTYLIKFNEDSVNPNFQGALKRQVLIFKNNQQIMCSINEKNLSRLLLDTQPSSQAEDFNHLNIGFGFLYYSLTRILKPKTVCVFGSTKSFSPICFSLGVKDNNNNGKVYFVDAGYSVETDGKPKGMGGFGFWKNKSKYNSLFSSFGIEQIIDPKIMTTSDFLKFHRQHSLPTIDLLYIDADHSYEGFRYDFKNFSKLISENGIILFHDVLVDDGTYGYHFGIKKYFQSKLLHSRHFSSFKIPIWPGIGMAQKINNISLKEKLKSWIVKNGFLLKFKNIKNVH
jgi:hypothetical protein